MEEEDPNSPFSVDQRWRGQRNDRTLHDSRELNDPSLNPKADTQISILDNEAEEASVLLFHPFENTMVVAYNTDALSVSLSFFSLWIRIPLVPLPRSPSPPLFFWKV